MAMNKIFLLFLTASLAGGGLAMAYAKEKKPAPEIRLVGEAQSCVQIHSINSTKIVDDHTIDFRMNGNKIMRNTLSGRCPGLKSADSFSYQTSMSQLCSVDIIHVLDNYGGSFHEGAGCGLGKFQPIEVVKAAR
jgi:hypothetical protein